jgi:hypothetical protein
VITENIAVEGGGIYSTASATTVETNTDISGNVPDDIYVAPE